MFAVSGHKRKTLQEKYNYKYPILAIVVAVETSGENLHKKLLEVLTKLKSERGVYVPAFGRSKELVRDPGC